MEEPTESNKRKLARHSYGPSNEFSSGSLVPGFVHSDAVMDFVGDSVALDEVRPVIDFVSTSEGRVRIKEIIFDSTKILDGARDPVAPALNNVRNWTDIPAFAILTGRNGSGKSQLLDYVTKYFDSELRQFITKNEMNPMFKTISTSQAVLTFTGSVDGTVHVYERMNTGTNNYLEQSVDVCHNYFLHPETFDKRLASDSRGQAYQHFHAQKIVPDKQQIREFIMKWDVTHTPVRHTTSISILNGMMEKYYNLRSEAIMHFTKVADLFSDLLKFYSPSFKAEPSSEIGGMLALSDQDRVALIEARTDAMLGQPPWVKMNEILQQYNFNLRLARETSDRSPVSAITFRRTVNNELVTIPTTKLSSGEQLLLELFGWLFYMDMPGNSGINLLHYESSLQLILMDEPDRHLDPTSCSTFVSIVNNEIVEKRKIQVIMTTHRTDTVMLAPEGSLFVIDRDSGDASIHRVPRLHALFKMSHNQRGLTNLRIKVYVEAYSDVQFYDAIVRQLLELINRRYEILLIDGMELPRLSRRYIPEFHSVAQSERSEGAGGNTQVWQAVARGFWHYDRASLIYANKTSKSDRIDPRFFQPFGLVDLDASADGQIRKQFVDIRSRIIKLNRYSYENFLYDPFILCSVIQDEAIKDRLQDCRVKQILNRIHQLTSDVVPDITLLSSTLEEYYNMLIERLFDAHVNTTDYINLIGASHDGLRTALESLDASKKRIKLRTSLSVEQVAIMKQIMLEKQSIVVFLATGRALQVKYPVIFFNFRGHDLAKVVLQLLNPHEASDDNRIDQSSIINGLVNSSAMNLPFDLIDTFYDLTRKLREQGNGLLKKSRSSGNHKKVPKVVCDGTDDAVVGVVSAFRLADFTSMQLGTS